METAWRMLELINLLLFTAFIIPRKQPAKAQPLLPVGATTFLRLTWLLPVLAFGTSLFIPHQISGIEWSSLVIAVIGNALVIKGKRDLGASHTWAGYYLPGAPVVRSGIFHWLPHPMYTGITLMILSCSAIYITRLPLYATVPALLCCMYIIGFLVVAALRETQHLLHPQAA